MRKIREIFAVMTVALLALTTLTSCNTATEATVPTTDEADRPAVTVKPKTPTPQGVFDIDKIVGGTTWQHQQQKPPVPEKPSVPQYDVDEIRDPKLNGYTDLGGMFGQLIYADAGYNDSEMAYNLFDGYESSKYCLPLSEDVTVVWSMNRPVALSAYALVTANDTKNYPERNPVTWELYGSTDGSDDSWNVIHSVTNCEEMPAENYQYVGFIVDNSEKYGYYKLHIVRGDEQPDGVLQISELKLYTDDTEDLGLADQAAPANCVSLLSKLDKSSITAPNPEGSHTVDCLFDNIVESGANGSNKYCLGGNKTDIRWSMTESVLITDYVIYTANDTDRYPERNPKNWVFYGSEDGSNWEVIVKVTNAVLPLTNYTASSFETGATKAYRYYRMEMQAEDGAGCIQFSELCLFTKK